MAKTVSKQRKAEIAKEKADAKKAADALKKAGRTAEKAPVPEDSDAGSSTADDDKEEDADFNEEDWEQTAAKQARAIEKLAQFKKACKTKFADYEKRLDAAEKACATVQQENRSVMRRLDDIEKRGKLFFYFYMSLI